MQLCLFAGIGNANQEAHPLLPPPTPPPHQCLTPHPHQHLALHQSLPPLHLQAPQQVTLWAPINPKYCHHQFSICAFKDGVQLYTSEALHSFEHYTSATELA